VQYKPVIFILFALYLIACFTPLRLEHDSIRYFAIKDCIESGNNGQCPALDDFLPNGYPVLLVGLSKTGLLNAFTIAFINAIYLLCSLVMTRKIIGFANPVIFYLVVLLNWTCIKLFAYPLSEMQYLFFSVASLYYFSRYTKEKKWQHLLFSFLLAALAVYTRTIGFALLAALVSGYAWENRRQLARKTILVPAIFIIAFIVVALFTLPGTAHYIEALFISGNQELSFMPQIVSHIKEWGQLLLNMPIGKAENYLPAIWVNIIFGVAGIGLIGWFIYALYRCRSSMPAAIIFYLVIYSLVIFKWPHVDPRFWAPVLPFIVAVILKAPLPAVKWWKPSVFAAYMLMGIAAFSFSFYTQFNKKAFARAQANGIFQKEYEIHFFGDPLIPNTPPIRFDVLEILEKYDRFSSHNSPPSSQ
jgi:hypothetical protein